MLGLSACSGSGGGDDSSDNTAPQGANEAPPTESGDRPDESPDEQEPANADAPEPVALLPLEARTPTGFRQVAANCDPGYPSDPNRSGSEEPDVDAGEDRYSTWITYAVPEEWGTGGRGAAGSGGVTGTDEDRSFDLNSENSSAGRVTIDVGWDNTNQNGEIVDWEGEPWTSFDYDSAIGDDEVTITFDNVGTVTVGDQEADLFYLDPAQAPEHVSHAEYRSRLNVFELPRNEGMNSFVPHKYSVVVTISFDHEQAELEQEMVEQILESFTLPECTWESTLLDHEIILNVDLNGDGHIRSVEDVQAEMQEQLDAIEDEIANR